MDGDRREQFDDLVRLSFFADVGKSIAEATTIEQTLGAVMEQIGAIFAPLNWSLLLRDAKTGDLRFTLVIGSGSEALRDQVIPRGRGVAGWIAENGQAVIIDDVSRDTRFDAQMDRLSGFTTRSIIGVPLKTRSRVFGVIELVNKLNGEPFAPLELMILTTIADFAAIAIEKAYYLRALRRIAALDPLTGAYNRRSLFRFLEREKARCARSGSPLSLLIVDIDRFKAINDSLGHEAGDETLRALAEILRKGVRKVDMISRYGGDEFVVIMPDTSPEAAEEVRKRLLDRVDEYNRDARLRFTISLGLHSAGAEDVDDIFRKADMDLYRGKSLRDEQNIENLPVNLQDLMTDEEEETAGRGEPGS
jgi:diguanylate cyclase (GGDEF)-like protein